MLRSLCVSFRQAVSQFFADTKTETHFITSTVCWLWQSFFCFLGTYVLTRETGCMESRCVRCVTTHPCQMRSKSRRRLIWSATWTKKYLRAFLVRCPDSFSVCGWPECETVGTSKMMLQAKTKTLPQKKGRQVRKVSCRPFRRWMHISTRCNVTILNSMVIQLAFADLDVVITAHFAVLG